MQSELSELQENNELNELKECVVCRSVFPAGSCCVYCDGKDYDEA